MSDVLPLRPYTLPAEDRPKSAPALEPMLLSARDLAAMLGVGLRTLRAMDTGGRIPAPLRLSPGCVRWRLDEIRSWLRAGAPDRATWLRLRDARS
jgi:predicted DNA-binding transcriptional regulator AlpA